jgi:hypothetical protein
MSLNTTYNAKQRQPRRAAGNNFSNNGNEQQQMDLYTSNQTFRFMTRNDDPEKVRLARIQQSLNAYLRDFERNPISGAFATKLAKATGIYMSDVVKGKLSLNLAPLDVYTILVIVSKYMLFNDLELYCFLETAVKLNPETVDQAALTEIADTCYNEMVFKLENLKAKTPEFYTLLMVSFFVALKVKIRTNDDQTETFLNAFENILSPNALTAYNDFTEKNPKVGEFNLVKVNDIVKKIEYDKVSEVEMLELPELYGELPQKKPKFVDDEEDPLDVYLTLVDPNRT